MDEKTISFPDDGMVAADPEFIRHKHNLAEMIVQQNKEIAALKAENRRLIGTLKTVRAWLNRDYMKLPRDKYPGPATSIIQFIDDEMRRSALEPINR